MAEEAQQLQAKINAETDETLESTKRMLTMMSEAQEAGIQTLVNLDDQGEQLDRIEEGLDADNQDTPDVRKLYLVSANYDQMFVGYGADFDRATYGLRIQSELTSAEANSLYTYALGNSALQVGKEGGVVNELN